MEAELIGKDEVMANLPAPPEIAPFRVFKVVRPVVPDETVQAHGIELTSFGALMFFEHTWEIAPLAPGKIGWKPVGLMRYVFAPGQWLDVKEMMVEQPTVVTIN